jgi:hypothetical protein
VALVACGHAPPPATSATPAVARKPAPVAPIDWLPSGSFALLHIDADRVRSQLPLELLTAELKPDAHTVLERTHSVTVAFDVTEGEPAMAAVFVGDYDQRFNPLLLAGQAERLGEDAARELWLAGGGAWMRTPEGYWLVGEPELGNQVFSAPASRAKRLSSEPWTAAPSEPYFASAVLHVTPPLQAALRQQARRESFAALIAQVGPALLELRDVRMTALPDGDGLRLRSGFDFASELGAQSGALVLRGLLALVGASIPNNAGNAAGGPQDLSSQHMPGADPTGAAPRAEDAELDQAAVLVMQAIDGAQIGVSGRQVRADVAFDAAQLGALGKLLRANERRGAAIAAEPRPAYQPPSAEQLAEREQAARADPTFGKVLDLVLARAGTDLELRDGLHPQSGKSGTRFLVVRVAQASAPALRGELRNALRGRGMQVVPVARGFEGRPSELGIFRARDEAAVLIARGTGEASAQGTSKRLASLVRSWQKRAAVEVAVAADDYFALELTAVPADPDRFVRELLELCPQAKPEEQRRQLLEQRRLDCFLQ